MIEQGETRSSQSLRNTIARYRVTLIKRATVGLLLLYLPVLVDVSRFVSEGSNYWLDCPYGGFRLFPIPYISYRAITVITPLSLLEAIVYVLFLRGGIWGLWMALGIAYIVVPPSWTRSLLERLGLSSEKEEGVGFLLGLACLGSVMLSVGTYVVNYPIYGPMPLSVTIGLSALVLSVLAFEVRTMMTKRQIGPGGTISSQAPTSL